MSLDRLDIRLLSELQANSALTNDQLAERVALSPSAVQRRVRRLERSGIIERRVALVDPAKVGRTAHFIVGLEVERERPELVKTLREWIASEPAVQQSYYVTGTADYVLVVVTRDISEFDALMSDMMLANPNIRRFITQVVMNTVKRGLFVPVEAG
jgi:Lrp/AsnC family leucine-responsive transcriptional regulator